MKRSPMLLAWGLELIPDARIPDGKVLRVPEVRILGRLEVPEHLRANHKTIQDLQEELQVLPDDGSTA